MLSQTESVRIRARDTDHKTRRTRKFRMSKREKCQRLSFLIGGVSRKWF